MRSFPPVFFEYEMNGIRKKGLQAAYFSNPELTGSPALATVENVLFAPDNQAPSPLIPKAPLSMRLSGFLVPKVSGKYALALKKKGGVRLYFNEKLLIDNWWSELENNGVTLELEAGKSYPVKVEYVSSSEKPYCALSWKTPEKKQEDQFKAEKLMARNSDVTVVVLGMNKSIEMEGT